MYKIMIVDDEMLVRIGVKSLIDWQELGFEIIAEAGNGQAAYEKYVALQPDIVITDIKMPKQDGIWLAQKIKEHNPKTEVIFLTCMDDFSYAKAAIKLKVSDYILKAEMEEEELKKILLEKKKKLDASSGGTVEPQGNTMETRKKEEHILGLLLSSSRSMELLREEFDKADLEWDTGKYCFIQFDFRSSLRDYKITEYQAASIMKACSELIYHKFQAENIEAFSKQFGKSITCFLMARNLNEIILQKCVQYLQNSIRQYFDIGFKSASSPVKETIEEARKDADWIFAASDYLFYLSEEEHLTRDTMRKAAEGRFIYPASMVKEFCEYIEDADSEAIYGKIDELKKSLDEYRGNSLKVKLELSHMIKDIFRRLDIGVNEEEIFSFQKSVINAEELEEVIDVIRTFVKNLMEEINQSRIDNTELLIKKAVQYIEDHYNQKISLDDIAGYVGISKYYFSVLFKKEMNITFSSYLNNVRIEKAKQLLKNPQLTINDVAYEVGFNDPQYFSKTFKKYVGMTISEYRNK